MNIMNMNNMNMNKWLWIWIFIFIFILFMFIRLNNSLCWSSDLSFSEFIGKVLWRDDCRKLMTFQPILRLQTMINSLRKLTIYVIFAMFLCSNGLHGILNDNEYALPHNNDHLIDILPQYKFGSYVYDTKIL